MLAKLSGNLHSPSVAACTASQPPALYRTRAPARGCATVVENCGTHFLDSGGANGRHWHNQLVSESGVDHPAELFERSEPSSVCFRSADGELTPIDEDEDTPQTDRERIDGSTLTPEDIASCEALRGFLVVDSGGNGYFPECGAVLVGCQH